MEVRNILVDVNPFLPQAGALSCAADLSRRFGANLIGISAAEPVSSDIIAEIPPAVLEHIEQERAEIEEALNAAEVRFRLAVPAGVSAKWHGLIMRPKDLILQESARADLIVVPAQLNQGSNAALFADLGEVLIRAARPILVVPDAVTNVAAARILVAWKDTKEARRAVADALPLLKLASDVFVAVVDEGNYSDERQSVDRVTEWMRSHDVKARSDVLPFAGSTAETLLTAAHAMNGDLIVSGAYGHGRLWERLLGGVTDELLHASKMPLFFSN